MMRGLLRLTYVTFAAVAITSGVLHAQTSDRPNVIASAVEMPPALSAPSFFGSIDAEPMFAEQPAGPPPTPRHTGVKAMTKHLVTNFKYLPSLENLYWAGAGGGLALAAHPFDDDVNRALVGNTAAENFFKPGAVLGELYTLLPSAAAVYTVGRIKDQPKVSHLGMDLIEALVMSETLTAALKFTAQRDRPDGSNSYSFPSGHAADTFAFATALERHLNWRYSVPAYVFASYVAISRLPANRHWLSDVVFGSTVGIVAGRTVTSNESERPYPVAVTVIPGGLAVMYTRNK